MIGRGGAPIVSTVRPSLHLNMQDFSLAFDLTGSARDRTQSSIITSSLDNPSLYYCLSLSTFAHIIFRRRRSCLVNEHI
jgi:hypothetical protein